MAPNGSAASRSRAGSEVATSGPRSKGASHFGQQPRNLEDPSRVV